MSRSYRIMSDQICSEKNINGRPRHLVVIRHFKADQTHLWLLVLVLALLIGPVILCYVVYTFFRFKICLGPGIESDLMYEPLYNWNCWIFSWHTSLWRNMAPATVVNIRSIESNIKYWYQTRLCDWARKLCAPSVSITYSMWYIATSSGWFCFKRWRRLMFETASLYDGLLIILKALIRELPCAK